MTFKRQRVCREEQLPLHVRLNVMFVCSSTVWCSSSRVLRACWCMCLLVCVSSKCVSLLDLCMWKATHWEQQQQQLRLVHDTELLFFCSFHLSSSLSPTLLLHYHPPSYFPLYGRRLYLYATGFLFVSLYRTVSHSWLSLSHSAFMPTAPISSFWVNLPSTLCHYRCFIYYSSPALPTPAPIFILLFSLHCYTTASLPLGLSLSLKQP